MHLLQRSGGGQMLNTSYIERFNGAHHAGTTGYLNAQMSACRSATNSCHGQQADGPSLESQ
jgi:hypothetical protein